MDIKDIKVKIEKELKKTSNLEEVDELRRAYLGRKGDLTQELRKLKDLAEDERRKMGRILNELKEDLEVVFQEKVTELKESEYIEKVKKEWIDVTRPPAKMPKGSIHPLTRTIQEIEDIFGSMGFEVAEGPQIENEWYNFEALNIPENHPARDLWDTFWIKDGTEKKNNKDERLLLRTHTSPVQARYMEANNPPIRIIAPGRVFRYEATDASHEVQFYQLEGLMVDEDISVANFRAIITEFLERFFRTNIKTRLRPSYFPFVEPGFEVDMSCITCGGDGCSVCSQTGWLEIMGAGMVHPRVFESVGYNPKEITGFAFGVGIDRLTMMKYKIDDIRLFYSGDVRFLQQFK
ncbi:MAG: phenylalanine--tRNA ligase subunit alpha [Candidatus Spechtbacterales bacterium]|nr:phenylalanine--tRNA ligase subunit alpha [Candidatus Spechtbacterales bacterium]